ncbi:MAG: hypothetical protein V9E96_18480 [Chitinophagaceae bacterium]
MHKQAIFSFLFIVVTTQVFAQGLDVETIEERFNAYNQQIFQEKIFVHTDKNFYLSGETIWFKLYNTEAVTNTPSPISKLAYVELLGSDSKAAIQLKIPINNSIGNGQFNLPLTLPTGNYILRAYTNLMKNSDVHFAFEKQIAIVSVFNQVSVDTTIKKASYDIQFFPEGGNLVNTLNSKIAFKATNNNGKGIDCVGKIINQNNDSVGNFVTQKFGMGTFVFTPIQGNTYKAIVTTKTNESFVANLPIALNEGYVLFTEKNSEQTTITVKATNNFLNTAVHLFVHANHNTKYKKTQVIENRTTVFVMNNDVLDEGVNYITLFNTQLQPLCERLLYKSISETVATKLTASNTTLTARKKIELDVTALTNNLTPVDANFSIAVVKDDSLMNNYTNVDIQQYEWLASHIKGKIEEPNFYFTETESASAAIDNLLLTQGWRRFNWNNIIANKAPSNTFLPEYESQIITGKVINKQTLLPAEGIAVYLSLPGKEFGFANAYSQADGSFFAIMPNIYGTSELVAQTNSKIDSNYRIDINSPYWSQVSTNTIPNFSLEKKWSNSLNEYSIALQAQRIYTPQKAVTSSANINYKPFYIKSDNKYLLDNYTRFSTMEEVMREYVADVLVRRKNNKFVFYAADNPRFTYFSTEPLLLVDGIPAFDADKIIAADPLKVQQIDVVARRFFSGKLAFDGIVNYSSYDGTMGIKSLSSESLVIDYDGIEAQREFYSPKYELATELESRLPDYRTVLYWNGNITTTTKGATKISFYTSDLIGKYTATLQGLTSNGIPLKATISFEVK